MAGTYPARLATGDSPARGPMLAARDGGNADRSAAVAPG
jgi:hypothetical protein